MSTAAVKKVNGTIKVYKVGIRPPRPIYPHPLRCVVFGNANSRSPPAALCPADFRTPRCFPLQGAFPGGTLPATRHGSQSAFTPPQKGTPSQHASPPETSALLEVDLSAPSLEPVRYRITFPGGLLLDIPRHFQRVQRSAFLRVVKRVERQKLILNINRTLQKFSAITKGWAREQRPGCLLTYIFRRWLGRKWLGQLPAQAEGLLGF